MSKDRIPYFNFYPTDFMRGVRGLTAQEVGIYTMLLCRMYEENGPIDLHEERLAAYCGCRSSTLAKTLSRLCDLGKIILVGKQIFNDRAAIEIDKRNRVLKSNSTAGVLSAEKRKQNQQVAETPVQQAFNHTDTDTEVSKSEGKPSLVRLQKSTRFDEFWNAYPHPGGAKKGRKPSLARYESAVKAGVSEQVIIDAAKRYASDRRVHAGYVKLPETWLDKNAWEDEIDTSRETQNGKPTGQGRLSAFIAGASSAPRVDSWEDSNPSQPLLARR